ncbi:MAG: 4-hydroxy-3-methylbut-2-enyl diphosphate reductase [Chloroflexi bacterium]|nr:4-hydroxy-3-methylbut-2-enyl diphosphate reductase [Chloroflexota bacterium]MXX66904.1 4-hydroxy-3-methylbut-2-enyl diphosphate reductase [Chloroflexota bacterium]MYC48523.1 4-hydroxy-3-methylbut-2-enyl diphosphate reductase [Chloroflexota bacterium]
MKVLLSVPRGFCAGVVRAIEIVELALRKYPHPVYVKHQIVHNPFVVRSLEDKGARTVECVAEIPEGATVVFSAHGSPPEDYLEAEKRGLKVIDATCPLVTKVHNEAKRFAKNGRNLVLIGHRGHQEVKGTMGQAEMHLVDDREEDNMPDWGRDEPVAVITQTTLSVSDTQQAVSKIQESFADVVVRNDLCYATTNRQFAVSELAKQVDMVLVVGAHNSSNCNRLREVAEAHGVPAHLINGPEELDPEWIEGVESVGITSGASTPEELILNVISALAPEEVTSLDGVEEDVNFLLPHELRT